MTLSTEQTNLDPTEHSLDEETQGQSSNDERRSVWMFALLLILAGFAAYENSFAGVFHFDDYPCIVTNHSLKSLGDTWSATSDEIPGGLRRRTVGRWTFALNRSLHDLDLWGYHAVNLAIHQRQMGPVHFRGRELTALAAPVDPVRAEGVLPLR